MDLLGAQTGCGINNVLNHWFTCKGVQNFGQVGAHALALSGGEDRDVERGRHGQDGKETAEPR